MITRFHLLTVFFKCIDTDIQCLLYFILPMDDGHGFYLQGSTLYMYLQYAMCIVLLINTAGRIDLIHACTL